MAGPPDLGELVGDFERAMRGLGRTAATLVDYRQRLRSFRAFVTEAGLDALQLTTSDVRRYHEALRARGLAPVSIVAYLNAVRVFYEHLVRRGLLEAPPVVELPRVRRGPPVHVLTMRQVMRILAQPDTTTPLGIRDRTILELLYSTAMRIGELRQLAVGSVDFEGGFVRIERGKGQKGRVVPAGKVALGWIRRYLAEVRFAHPREGTLFVTVHGHALSGSMLHLVVRRYVRAARIPFGASAHDFRHAAATHLLRGDGNRRRASLVEVRDILGHASANTTRLYTRIDITDLERELRRRHFRDRRGRR